MDGYSRAGDGPVAGEHVVGAAFVGGLAVGHRADDGDLVGDLGGFLQVLAELDARDRGVDGAEGAAVFGGGEGFRVEGFLVGHAAGQEDVDDALATPFVGVVDFLVAAGLGAQELGQVSPRPPIRPT